MINYSSLPPHMQDLARRYIEKGIPGGSFFTALVSNDLMRSFLRADDMNTAAMRTWAVFLYTEAPNACWGSPEKVRAWIDHRGLEGME